MKIRELLRQEQTSLSFEVFPPKKDTDFANVETATLGIAKLQPSYMSVTYGAGGGTSEYTVKIASTINPACKRDSAEIQRTCYLTSDLRMCKQRKHQSCTERNEIRRHREYPCTQRRLAK